MMRGEIWWVDFGLAFGSMTLGRRPAVVVQNDNFNASKIATTVAIPISTNLLLSEYKDNVFLSAKISKLPKDSVVVTPQIGAIDKSCFLEKVSKLPPSIMIEISHSVFDLLGCNL